MYGKYTLPVFYESPKNWGYLCACANSVYQASPRGGGGEGPGNEARVTLVGISKITVQEIVWFTDN